MKTNRAKLFGIIALVAIIGFTFTACNKGGSASGGRVKANPESDFEVKAIDGGQGVEITKYIGDKWEVGIPSKIRGLPVTSIGGEAFREKSLIKVTIPNSVTTIGDNAFRSNQLTSVTIPNSVTTIGDAAFYKNQLTSVTIPNSVTSIGGGLYTENGAFSNNQLTSVTIPDSVTRIDGCAFDDNPLTSITIGRNVNLGVFRVAAFPSGFDSFYNGLNKKAGTYIRSGNSWSEEW